MKGKKGAEMTIGTIIIIILAILVLVFLVYGFSTGWGNLWERITGLGGGGSNVDSVKQACQVACSTNSQYDYEQSKRTIRWSDSESATDVTCKDLESGICIDKKAKTKIAGLSEADCGNLKNTASKTSWTAAQPASGGSSAQESECVLGGTSTVTITGLAEETACDALIGKEAFWKTATITAKCTTL